MPEVIETVIYTFAELSIAAQEAARDWYRELGAHHGWWQWVYEDFAQICACLGIILKTPPVTTNGKAATRGPCIWF